MLKLDGQQEVKIYWYIFKSSSMAQVDLCYKSDLTKRFW